MPTLAERVLAGEPRAIARAISLIEDEDPASADLIAQIFSRTGRAYLIGVTGPPGAGKSTLVDRLVTAIRTQPRSSNLAFILGSASTTLISRLSFSTIGLGVSRGAPTPYHAVAS